MKKQLTASLEGLSPVEIAYINHYGVCPVIEKNVALHSHKQMLEFATAFAAQPNGTPWLNIKTHGLPPPGEVVDLFTTQGRLTDYVLIKNARGLKGNHYFAPTKGGITCVHFGGKDAYTQATHWRRIDLPVQH